MRQAEDVLVQELDDQLLLLRPGSPDVLHLDTVASDVWRLLSTAPTRAELVAALAEGYGVPAQLVGGDIEPTLALLRRHGLLQIDPA